MDQNLEHAAQEYLEKRSQLGARVAAAAVIQKFGVTALALSEYLRDHGQLLAQQSQTAIVAASEVHYAQPPARSSIAAALDRTTDPALVGARTGRIDCSQPNLSQVT